MNKQSKAAKAASQVIALIIMFASVLFLALVLEVKTGVSILEWLMGY